MTLAERRSHRKRTTTYLVVKDYISPSKSYGVVIILPNQFQHSTVKSQIAIFQNQDLHINTKNPT